MKTNCKSFLLILCIFCLYASQAWGQIYKIETEDIESGEKGVIEYEFRTFNSSFDRWFAIHAKSIDFYEQSYLENWNRQLAQQWNRYLSSPMRTGGVPNPYIDYDANVDYGKELNYKLFYYFKYRHQSLLVFDNKPSDWRRRSSR